MSTKLDADEIALTRFSEDESAYDMTAVEGYAAAIREVAQPIADERDELREALDDFISLAMTLVENRGIIPGANEHQTRADVIASKNSARAILAKYPKP